MNPAAVRGQIQTVLGAISPAELGITLPHEHIIADGAWFFKPSQDPATREMALKPVTTDILWWLRYHHFRNVDDRRLSDESLAVEELRHFREAGGGAVVELTSCGLGRAPEALARIARATGLQIIMGSGYYIAASHPPDMNDKSEEQIAEEITRDIREGVDAAGVRAGIIGEIGTSWPMRDNEAKCLRAAAQAQRDTGAPINVHPGQHEEMCMACVHILEEAGADLSRTVLSHIDRAVRCPENRLALLQKGCYLEYDLFGLEGYYPLDSRVVDLPNDTGRINEIVSLADQGYADRILISQDIWNKTQLRHYGGGGYDHILRNVLPVMRAKGVPDSLVNEIMVENPKRLLTLV